MEKKTNTFFTKVIPIALAMGIMLSPDTLVLLGNLMGKTGWTGLVLMLASMVIFFIHAANYQNLSQSTGETDFLITRLVYIPWTTRGLAAIFLSTGILVSSGFVFNEVFLHWFPNFGFAFLLLGILLGIHLTGIPMGLKAQVIFVTLTVAGLLTLILAGILTPGSQILGTQLIGSQPPGIQATAPGIMIQDKSILFLALVLWVGFDLGALSLDQNTDRPGKSKKLGPLVWTIGGTGILFLLWAMVSIQHVPLAKLASSTLPHLKTARYLLGDTGRFIMGGIIIFGTLGAVNALFLACRINTNEMAGGLLPQWTKNQGAVPIFLALSIGLMMAKGMAGSDKLEIWIRAIFLVWLFSYALISLSFLTRQFSLANLTASLITLTGVCFLLWSGGEIICFSLTLGAGLIPGFVFTWKSSNQKGRSKL